MDMSPTGCWDCPEQFGLPIVIELLTVLVVFALGLRLFWSRRPVLKGLSSLPLATSALCYLFGVAGVLKYGLTQPGGDYRVSRPLTLGTVIVWLLMTFVAARTLFVRYGKRPRTNVVGGPGNAV
jgi:hypothetical protein